MTYDAYGISPHSLAFSINRGHIRRQILVQND